MLINKISNIVLIVSTVMFVLSMLFHSNTQQTIINNQHNTIKVLHKTIVRQSHMIDSLLVKGTAEYVNQ